MTATNGSAGEKPGDGAEQPEILAKDDRRQKRRHADDRPDRKVDLTGGQHEDHADRHDGDGRRLLDDVEKVAGGEESVVAKDDREADEDQDEADIDDILARIDRPQTATASPPSTTPPVSEAGGSRWRDWNQPSFTLSLVTAMRVDRVERLELLADQRGGRSAGERLADGVGLVGDDGADIAALDHVERQRLGEVERHDLRVGIAAVAERREDELGRLGPGHIDAVEVRVLDHEGVDDVLGLGRIGEALLGDDLDVLDTYPGSSA